MAAHFSKLLGVYCLPLTVGDRDRREALLRRQAAADVAQASLDDMARHHEGLGYPPEQAMAIARGYSGYVRGPLPDGVKRLLHDEPDQKHHRRGRKNQSLSVWRFQEIGADQVPARGVEEQFPDVGWPRLRNTGSLFTGNIWTEFLWTRISIAPGESSLKAMRCTFTGSGD